MFKDGALYSEENTCDPIKDLAVVGNTVFTVQDLDVTITEFIVGK